MAGSPSPPSSSAARPYCASPTTSVCASCCVRSPAAAGTRCSVSGASRSSPSRPRRCRTCSSGLPGEPEVSRAARARSDAGGRGAARDECLLDLARPTRTGGSASPRTPRRSRWRAARASRGTRARRDRPGARAARRSRRAGSSGELTERTSGLAAQRRRQASAARPAPGAQRRRPGGGRRAGRRTAPDRGARYEVEFRRDRRGGALDPRSAGAAPAGPRARRAGGLRSLRVPARSLGLAAVERDARADSRAARPARGRERRLPG